MVRDGQATSARSDAMELAFRDPAAAFDRGWATALVTRRNPNLGHLLTAERALFYVQILYRLLLFRRDHELEPLYEDAYRAVRPALLRLVDRDDYGLDQFRTDLAQLEAWGLVSSRIEMERLRGYRDTRRRKFRYALAPEAIAFLEWLEQRVEDEFQKPGNDTRDLLEEVCGSLSELARLLDRFGSREEEDGDARRILYQLFKVDELSLATNAGLAELNARLLGFVHDRYRLEDAKAVLTELEAFVDGFLRQIHALRQRIVSVLDDLNRTRYQGLLGRCVELLEAERRQTPHLLRQPHDIRAHLHIPAALQEFYRDGGRLDALCRRIHGSSLLVWRKLHVHLRELERTNTRVEDLRACIAEVSRLAPEAVPHGFLTGLVCSAGMRSDMHDWDENQRADPPLPRRRSPLKADVRSAYLRGKNRGRGPVVSIERARLNRLRDWIRTAVKSGTDEPGTRLSAGVYREFDDLLRLMDVSRAALLDSGRRLHEIRFSARPVGEDGHVELAERHLRFRELLIQSLEAERVAAGPGARSSGGAEADDARGRLGPESDEHSIP